MLWSKQEEQQQEKDIRNFVEKIEFHASQPIHDFNGMSVFCFNNFPFRNNLLVVSCAQSAR